MTNRALAATVLVLWALAARAEVDPLRRTKVVEAVERASPAVVNISTTQVVASAVVGVGGGRRRWRHVHWAVVRDMALGWLVTLPVTAALAAGAVLLWEALA